MNKKKYAVVMMVFILKTFQVILVILIVAWWVNIEKRKTVSLNYWVEESDEDDYSMD